MDENFIDVTKLGMVEERVYEDECTGYVFGSAANLDNCPDKKCSCTERLKIGSKIAFEIRLEIFERLGITTSCGIAWNKLLSKMVGSENKPNKQTTLFPSQARELMLSLTSLKQIPGIGSANFKLLQQQGLATPEDVLNATTAKLNSVFPDSREMISKVRQLCEGIDHSSVKTSSDKPLSIGLEDRFRCIATRNELEEKLGWLLSRLIKLLQEDGRKPKTIKVTTRDLVKDRNQKQIFLKDRKGGVGKFSKFQSLPKFHKESRQCKISPRLFEDLK